MPRLRSWRRKKKSAASAGPSFGTSPTSFAAGDADAAFLRALAGLVEGDVHRSHVEVGEVQAQLRDPVFPR
jgi:hypothetical protein